MYAGKEGTAEFGDYHSAEAVAHMAHFCVGDLVGTSNHLAVTGHADWPAFPVRRIIRACPDAANPGAKSRACQIRYMV